jgi:hypothetical protein
MRYGSVVIKLNQLKRAYAAAASRAAVDHWERIHRQQQL